MEIKDENFIHLVDYRIVVWYGDHPVLLWKIERKVSSHLVCSYPTVRYCCRLTGKTIVVWALMSQQQMQKLRTMPEESETYFPGCWSWCLVYPTHCVTKIFSFQKGWAINARSKCTWSSASLAVLAVLPAKTSAWSTVLGHKRVAQIQLFSEKNNNYGKIMTCFWPNIPTIAVL